MLIIPAIDLRKGRCVRLVQGNLRDEMVFSEEPVSIAKLWKLKGAELIHVIDLDGAFTGTLKNLEIVLKIIRTVKLPVQLGGGIRDMDTIDELVKEGVERVILGTRACASIDFVRKTFEKYGEKIIVSIDSVDGQVAVKGWKDVTDKKALVLAKELKGLGMKRVIFTDIKKDGMLGGPNFKAIKELASTTELEVIASGGIATLEDIENLKALEKYGVVSAIIGKALYTGKIDLKEAIKLAEKPLSADRRARKRKMKRRQIKKKK